MKKIIIRKNVFAFAGSRTRVYCLEGNYPNRWTTNACCNIFCLLLFSHVKKFDMLSLQLSKQKLIYSGGKVTEEFVETEYYKDLNCVDKEHHTVLILPPTVQFCFSLFLL